MKVKALRTIYFGGRSFREGEVYDQKEIKGLNPSYFEAILKENILTVEDLNPPRKKRKYTKRKK
jgi:hypothetical protein